MSKPVRATVLRSIATQDGTWLTVVRLRSPKQDVSVRTAGQVKDGTHVLVEGYGAHWRFV